MVFLDEVDNPLIQTIDEKSRPMSLAELKQQFMHEQMLQRRPEYTFYRNVR